jgi:hypothetical protein
MSRLPRLFAFLALCFCALPLTAQTNFGRISGTVTDPSGAAIPAAKVIITNTDTHAVRSLTTDDHGFYVSENLPIGPYSVTVDQAGFRKAERRGLFVVADGRVTADFSLQVGEATTTVDVVAQEQPETLNTVSGEVSHIIDKEQVDNLALNGRSYMELLTLVPGATVTSLDQFSELTSLSATNQTVNGHRTNQNNMTVDGLGNLDAGANGSLINNISPDFMQEVKIQTSNFSAQYGRSAGVAFNLMTKNGTNNYHGALFEYFRNDAMDAATSSPRITPNCASTISAGTSAGRSRRTSCSFSPAKNGSGCGSSRRPRAPRCRQPPSWAAIFRRCSREASPPSSTSPARRRPSRATSSRPAC